MSVITNQTLTLTITSGSVDTVIRKDNCRVDVFGDYVRLTDYTGERYEFLFSDIRSPSTTSAVELAQAIEEFLNTGGGGSDITSITSTDGSVSIDNADPSAPDLSVSLHSAYVGGSFVNGAYVIIDGANSIFGIVQAAAIANTGGQVNALGFAAAQNNSGFNVNAFGSNAAQNNQGSEVNALGPNAALNNQGNRVNAFGNSAAAANTANDCNFFGNQAGDGNTTPFGVSGFSVASIPQYNNHSDAAAALTVANGCVSTTIYLYLNTSNNTVGWIIPT